MSDGSSIPLTGDRFATVTEDDHRGVVWVVSILCLIYALMIIVIRIEARRKSFGWDDSLSSAATVFAIAQYIAIFVGTQNGLGKAFSTLQASDASSIGRSVLASQILLLLALCLAKCSVILLCRRLFTTTMRRRLILCDVTMGVCLLWGIASVLAIAINCSPLELIGFRTSFCPGLITRWKAIGTLDCLTEILIVLLSVLVVWPLQMSVARKLRALISFFLRLIIIVFAVLHITSLSSSTSSLNRGVALAMPSVYLQVELLYALLSSAIPALNRWLRNFDTSMGTAWASAYGSQQYGSNHHTDKSVGQDYQMKSLTGSQAKSNGQSALANDSMDPWKDQYIVSCEPSNKADTRSLHSQEGTSNKSTNSEDMIIRKDVTWRIQHEDSDNNRAVGQAV